ncbi:MAG: hypothetical protein KAS81_09180 [Anaerolineales bacterium]|nr:hypothetical protein [Anaerolineales bacterium]
MLRSTASSTKVFRVNAQSLLILCLVMLVVFIPVLPPILPNSSPAVSAMPETPPLTTNVAAPAPAEPDAQPLAGKELVERRDAFSRHFDRGDGEFVAMVGVNPINYRDAAGQWQPIEAGFAPVQGGWQVSRNSLQSTLAQDSTAVQLETGGVLLVWQPSGLLASDGELSLLELAVPLPPN